MSQHERFTYLYHLICPKTSAASLGSADKPINQIAGIKFLPFYLFPILPIVSYVMTPRATILYFLKYVHEVKKRRQKMEKKMGVMDLVRPSRTHKNLPFCEDVFLDRTFILMIFLCIFRLIIGRRISSVTFGIFRWLSKNLGSSPSQKSALFTKMLCNIFWNKSVVDVINYGPPDESKKKVGNGLRFHSIT